jgi:hypothetical protein
LQNIASLRTESIHEIPNDFPLSARMRRACASVQRGVPWFNPQLARKLAELRFPTYFMDFETVNPAIPRYPGMRPFDLLPFQWSLHLQKKRGASLEHFEFLAHPMPITAAVPQPTLPVIGKIWKYSGLQQNL